MKLHRTALQRFGAFVGIALLSGGCQTSERIDPELLQTIETYAPAGIPESRFYPRASEIQSSGAPMAAQVEALRLHLASATQFRRVMLEEGIRYASPALLMAGSDALANGLSASGARHILQNTEGVAQLQAFDRFSTLVGTPLPPEIAIRETARDLGFALPTDTLTP